MRKLEVGRENCESTAYKTLAEGRGSSPRCPTMKCKNCGQPIKLASHELYHIHDRVQPLATRYCLGINGRPYLKNDKGISLKAEK